MAMTQAVPIPGSFCASLQRTALPSSFAGNSAPFTLAEKSAFAWTFVKSKPVHTAPSFSSAVDQQSSSALPDLPLHLDSATDGELNCTISTRVLKMGAPPLDCAGRGSTRSR